MCGPIFAQPAKCFSTFHRQAKEIALLDPWTPAQEILLSLGKYFQASRGGPEPKLNLSYQQFNKITGQEGAASSSTHPSVHPPQVFITQIAHGTRSQSVRGI